MTGYEWATCRYCKRMIRSDVVSRTGWVHVDPQGFTSVYCDLKPMAVPE